MPFSIADVNYMTQALRVAQQGMHSADPNPRVGCVLVKQDQVIGVGSHAYHGGPHAEVVALEQAGAEAAGSHAYVTLEPCCHTGKTGPCSQALIAAGVTHVTYALRDPDSRVSGKGGQQLVDAGIEVRSGLLEQQARDLNIGFISRHQRGRPWVRLKLAISLDGRIAASDGSSAWITGAAARADVQQWRARASVILTGSGTINWDNPRLNVRLAAASMPLRQPLRVVLSSRFIVDPSAQVFADRTSALVMGCHAAEGMNTLQAAEVKTAMVPAVDGGVDLPAALQLLAERYQANEVHVECGPGLAGSLLSAECVDELLIYQADCLLGDQGLPMLKLPGLKNIAEAIRLPIAQTRQLGNDRCFRYQLTKDFN